MLLVCGYQFWNLDYVDLVTYLMAISRTCAGN